MRAPHATLKVSHHRVTAVVVSFSAPFAVTSAAEEYAVTSGPCGPRAEGLRSAVLDRNVSVGETVHVTLEYPFEAACARPGLGLQVIYQAAGPDAKRSYGRAPGELIVGRTRIRLPRDDRAAAAPRAAGVPGAAAIRRRLHPGAGP